VPSILFSQHKVENKNKSCLSTPNYVGFVPFGAYARKDSVNIVRCGGTTDLDRSLKGHIVVGVLLIRESS